MDAIIGLNQQVTAYHTTKLEEIAAVVQAEQQKTLETFKVNIPVKFNFGAPHGPKIEVTKLACVGA